MMIDERKLIGGPIEEAVRDIYNEIYQFYRNRPALPVDDHIVLGED